MDMYATLRYICVCVRVCIHRIFIDIWIIRIYLILFQGIVSKKKPCIAAALDSATWGAIEEWQLPTFEAAGATW